VIRTRVGYAGGKKENPTYHQLGDHTETLEVDYDPARISYEKLLEIFWEEHNPTSSSWSTQYKAAVFYHGDEQKRLALATRDRLAAMLGKTIRTEVIPFSRFYPAEAYHQKYYLRGNKPFLKELQRYHPQDEGLMNSTAAARVNGYLGRNGTADSLKAEIEGYGLSESSRQALLHAAGVKR
jgi:peptide-methionine (S)-S-oxide reductase